MGKQRADVMVLQTGLATSRNKAQALILAGEILDQNGQRIEKPGQLLSSDVQLKLKNAPLTYVSRGGLKLTAALNNFNINVSKQICLDIGASTGGFTDCLLKSGAQKVYAVDVGYGQLHWSLRQNPQVIVIERCNVRYMDPTLIIEACQVVVIDVSFISLKLVVPSILKFLEKNARIIALVKPQFEVGRKSVGKGGIVREAPLRQKALEEIVNALYKIGFHDIKTMNSPIMGAKGNQEYLLSGLLG